MEFSLKNKAALITGGGQGVGQGIARSLASAGSAILIAQRSVDSGEAEAEYLRQTYGVEADFFQADVTKAEDVDAMVAHMVKKFGRIDTLVNNAGGSKAIRAENHSDADMAHYFDLNYWSAFRAMRAAFPAMKAQKFGRIINLGSLNGVNAHMFTLAYNASKEAVRALTRTAAVEWGIHGITANIICPSATSPAAREYFEANPEMAQHILSQVPVGRFGEAQQDIGSVALFLASEQSAYVTGNTFFVDGGGHINGVPWRPDVED